ncbi:hypothetical protein GGER_09000 [Serratia rubidaea]
MSNQQAADDIILNGITLKAANRDVILSTKRVHYAQKQLAQLKKLAALNRQADEVQQQLNHNRAARASQPATISSMEDIKTGQQLIFDAVFQQARSKMLAFQQGRLSKKLGKKVSTPRNWMRPRNSKVSA